ncbi:MAG TPA: FAD-linked oxidase C-terminal domain-containing protein, partial [Thermoanaerobaculia bacterium]|nr:FAD-linked oxidase C-terminal domain-containing protein [Thermoanaerobaculia bacterium]
LVDSPQARTLVVLGYPSVYEAGDHIPRILEFGPIGLEGIDDALTADMKKKGLNVSDLELLPDGNGWLLCEFGGSTREEADGNARRMMEALKHEKHAPSMKLYDDPHEEKLVWEIRESGLGATANIPDQPLTWPGFEDAAVPPDKVGSYLRDFEKLLGQFGYRGDLYGHFGQGCIHTRIDFDLRHADGIRDYREFVHRAAELVVSYGGSLSGEHGDGQARAELLPIMYGDELIGAFREFKSIWDPDWKMNPGKVVDPYRIDENLRLGTGYEPWNPETYFKFPKDDGLFSRAGLRCVGVGKCRRLDSGVMCPSFQATREEEHSTRGRARLLFEMFNGAEVPNDWDNPYVHDALDLCLACKGCKGDCPVNVDMATYKAEFLAHYYEHHPRPASAYAMGLIYWWARLASIAPRAANFFSQTPPFSNAMKAAAGVANQRRMPPFATSTFRARFRKRAHPSQGKRVLLFPDTFNNYFHPQIAEAAVDVLEKAGYSVVIPDRSLCCGRPLYDFGFLKAAKRLLRRNLRALAPEISRGTPIIGLEPSCVSVFRDELTDLFPDDAFARRFQSQVFMLSEFIQNEDGFPVPKLKRKAIVQGHCHHRSVLKFDAEQELFERMGLDAEVLDSGCCGMAGAFGFERTHYDISMKCAERVLFPRVREADDDTLIIADGFSCHEQIVQSTTRKPLHIAEVLRMGSD